jgi:hypothetical protein
MWYRQPPIGLRRSPSPNNRWRDKSPEIPWQASWPSTPVVGMPSPQPLLVAPSPEGFGIEHFGESMIKGSAGYTFERNLIQDAGVSLPPLPIWPRPTVYAIPTDIIMLPVPSAYNFKYSRPFLLRNREKPEPAKKKTAATRARNAARFTGDAPSSASLTGAQRQPLRPIGHQLSVMRPTVTTLPR